MLQHGLGGDAGQVDPQPTDRRRGGAEQLHLRRWERGMNRFIRAEIRGADLGTDLLASSQGSRGTQGRTTDFKPVDSSHGFETAAIAPHREGIVRGLVVSTSDGGIDGHRDLGGWSLGRDR